MRNYFSTVLFLRGDDLYLRWKHLFYLFTFFTAICIYSIHTGKHLKIYQHNPNADPTTAQFPHEALLLLITCMLLIWVKTPN